VQTLASAMDVGDPSNMERLRSLVCEADILRERLGVLAVTDDLIEAAIRRDYAEFGFATCPHTATATHTWRQLDDGIRNTHDWILVATAHAAKFETIVEPLIGAAVPVPDGLAEILARPSRSVAIDADLAALGTALRQFFSA
jgi:threonine synthase